MEIRGKNILITGASRGIGRYLATYLAPKAAMLVLAARDVAQLQITAVEVRKAGGQCLVQPCDLCEPATLDMLAQAGREQAGGVDILINNAADVTSKPFLDTSADEIERLIRTNVIGPLQLARLIAPMMLARGGGMIVNISSLAGCKPNPTQTVYSISKAAVNGMSEALRQEFRGAGINVMNVALGSIAVAAPEGRGRYPVAVFARKLERAITREEPEVYLSPVTKWLMRVYRACPFLMQLR